MDKPLTGVKQGKWSHEEDLMLAKAIQVTGEKQWRKVAQMVPGRSSVQCMHRWSKILKPGRVKGPWSSSEDSVLCEWVRTMGPTGWSRCAAKIAGRNGKQCRERWCNVLDPGICKGAWKAQEDFVIYELHSQFGSKWAKIALRLPGRTENSIKNRFYSTLRKQSFEQIDDVLASPNSDNQPETDFLSSLSPNI
jgi:hypothetical protein